MTESDLWVKLREHASLFKWIRVDTVTPPGFFDAVLFKDAMVGLVELKVAPGLDHPDGRLRKTQEVFAALLAGKTQVLFHFVYDPVHKKGYLKHLASLKVAILENQRWEHFVSNIEFFIYEQLKQAYDASLRDAKRV